MPIPAFTNDNVLPPFLGSDGPGGVAEYMTPYVSTATEVVAAFACTDSRREILHGWLRHRAALRALGFSRGFQWLDGSFVENKEPRDLDVVAFLHRPPTILNDDSLTQLMWANRTVFGRTQVKVTYKLDFFSVDLDGPPESLMDLGRYYLGLFSHRRIDYLWKGMLQVRLEDIADDTAALAALGLEPAPSVTRILR